MDTETFTLTLLWLLSLLLVGEIFSRFGIMPIPSSITGGTIGLLLGPSGFGLITLDPGLLEALVACGLTVLFVGISLQTPAARKRTPGRNVILDGPVPMGIGVAWMAFFQAAVGTSAVIIARQLTGSPIHPALGLCLPLGFIAGPGQSLSFGALWETIGLKDGPATGLIFADIGFAWCLIFGVPLALWAARLKREQAAATAMAASSSKPSGERFVRWPWVSTKKTAVTPAGNAPVSSMAAATATPTGTSASSPAIGTSADSLAIQCATVGTISFVSYGLLVGLPGVLMAAVPTLKASTLEKLMDGLWAGQYILAGAIGFGVRAVHARVCARYRLRGWLDTTLLGHVAGSAVDLMTAAAIMAVRLSVVRANLGMIVAITTAGGLLTLVTSIWISRRCFPNYTLDNCVVLFGSSTGTLPLAVALLRIADPQLLSPAVFNQVLGVPLAAVPLLPPGIGVAAPFVFGWPNGFDFSGPLLASVWFFYCGVILLLWSRFGTLKLRGLPVCSLWPPDAPSSGIGRADSRSEGWQVMI